MLNSTDTTQLDLNPSGQQTKNLGTFIKDEQRQTRIHDRPKEINRNKKGINAQKFVKVGSICNLFVFENSLQSLLLFADRFFITKVFFTIGSPIEENHKFSAIFPAFWSPIFPAKSFGNIHPCSLPGVVK